LPGKKIAPDFHQERAMLNKQKNIEHKKQHYATGSTQPVKKHLLMKKCRPDFDKE